MLDPASTLVRGSRFDPPASAANTDRVLGLVCEVARGHKPVGRIADARDSALRGLRVWGYCVAEFYHEERNHQGLDNRLIESGDEVPCTTGEIECRERLGGMLRYYYRQAA
jgi:hypothetical protein